MQHLTKISTHQPIPVSIFDFGFAYNQVQAWADEKEGDILGSS